MDRICRAIISRWVDEDEQQNLYLPSVLRCAGRERSKEQAVSCFMDGGLLNPSWESVSIYIVPLVSCLMPFRMECGEVSYCRRLVVSQ